MTCYYCYYVVIMVMINVLFSPTLIYCENYTEPIIKNTNTNKEVVENNNYTNPCPSGYYILFDGPSYHKICKKCKINEIPSNDGRKCNPCKKGYYTRGMEGSSQCFECSKDENDQQQELWGACMNNSNITHLPIKSLSMLKSSGHRPLKNDDHCTHACNLINHNIVHDNILKTIIKFILDTFTYNSKNESKKNQHDDEPIFISPEIEHDYLDNNDNNEYNQTIHSKSINGTIHNKYTDPDNLYIVIIVLSLILLILVILLIILQFPVNPMIDTLDNKQN